MKRVRARAPLRLGLAGGGTDVSPYSDDFGGFVLNVTINKYAYATIIARSDDFVEFIAADNDIRFKHVVQPELPTAAGVELHIGVYNHIVKHFNNGKGLPITVITHSEAPPGSGLGSSSTMVVALLQAFSEYLALPLGEYEIAQLAYQVERVDLGFSGGKQDQYAATFGGFNFMEFYADKVVVNPLRIKPDYWAELEASLVLYYTGVSRESANIINEQTRNLMVGRGTTLQALHNSKEEAVRMKEAILRGDFDRFVSSMKRAWESKKMMASSISNAMINQVYEAAISAGARAGKVSGAGGGGFMMFFVPPEKRSYVMNRLSGFDGQVVTCNFTDQGGHAWRL